MVPTTLISRTYPKRKRAEVSYHESSSDEDEPGEEEYCWYTVSDQSHSTGTAKKLRTTVSTKALPKRKIFPFTLLPPELKNYIYELALVSPTGIYLTSKTKHLRRTIQRSVFKFIGPSAHRKRRHQSYESQFQLQSQPKPPGVSSTVTVSAFVPNILLLNKAIHAETQPILYAGNGFALEDTMALFTFLTIIGPKNRATLTNVTIYGWGFTKAHKAFNYPALTMLADAVNLINLDFDCQITYVEPGRFARQLYRDGFRWLEAIGAAKGSLDAGVDIITIDNFHPDWLQPFDAGRHEEEMKVFRAELRKMLQQAA